LSNNSIHYLKDIIFGLVIITLSLLLLIVTIRQMGNPAKDQPTRPQKHLEQRHYNQEIPALSDFTSNATGRNLKFAHKSTNDKDDFIGIQLQRYLIALQILEENNLIEEFRSAVKGGANLPTEAITVEATVGAQA
jgi:hypothetical protein